MKCNENGLDSEDVTRWLANSDSFLNLIEIDRNSRAASAFLALHLTGRAEAWYFKLPDAKRNNFGCLKDALLETFAFSTVSKFHLRCQLNSLRQKENESVTSYADVVIVRLNDLNFWIQRYCFILLMD